jgi:hypothetical protein
MQQANLKRWALLGARERLAQIASEAAAIYKAFPELRSRAIGFGERSTSPARSGASKPRVMSAEARKRISDAQKARWAKQRKEKEKGK